MKSNLNIFLIAILAIAFSSCNQTNKVLPIDEKAETEVLKKIAKQENLDFYKKDLKTWANHFDHSEKLYWICVEDDVTLRATGWNDLNQFVAQWMKENPIPE